MMKRTSLRQYAGLLAIFAVLLCAEPALTA